MSNNQVGFVQQGSLDWVSFGKATVAFPIEVLARLSKAGINALTVGVGCALCQGMDLKLAALSAGK
jgi:hypothetical protein